MMLHITKDFGYIEFQLSAFHYIVLNYQQLTQKVSLMFDLRQIQLESQREMNSTDFHGASKHFVTPQTRFPNSIQHKFDMDHA